MVKEIKTSEDISQLQQTEQISLFQARQLNAALNAIQCDNRAQIATIYKILRKEASIAERKGSSQIIETERNQAVLAFDIINKMVIDAKIEGITQTTHARAEVSLQDIALALKNSGEHSLHTFLEALNKLSVPATPATT